MKFIATFTILMLMFSAAFAGEDPNYTAPFDGSIAVDRPGAVTKIYGYHFFPIMAEGTAQNASGYTAVWPLAPATAYTFLTTAGTVEISSSSANDTVAGTGARTIEIVGLDSNYNIQYEDITTLGQAAAVDGNNPTSVHSKKSYIRILSARVKTLGSGTANAGIIYVHTDHGNLTSGVPGTLTKVLAYIPTGMGVSDMGVFTVPDGFTAIVDQIDAFNPAAITASVELRSKPYGRGWERQAKIHMFDENGFSLKGPWMVPEKSDIVIYGHAAADSGSKLVVNAKIRLVKD